MSNANLFEENFTTWVEVILPLALPNTLTYAVPKNFSDQIQIGKRVEVGLGKSKKYAGIIKSILHTEPKFPTRPIQNILDDEPILFEPQIKLWEWISSYYMCTVGEVMDNALPTNFKISSETILIYNPDFGNDFTMLSDQEYLVAEALEINHQLHLKEVQQILDLQNVYPVVRKLIDKQVCFVWEKMNEKYKAKQENFVMLHANFRSDDELSKLLNEWKGAPKQMEVLLSIIHLEKTEGFVTQSQLIKKSGASAAQIKALAEKGIVVIEKRNVDRIATDTKFTDVKFELSAAQNETLEKIKISFEKNQVTLLRGVTGSGKTEIYIKLIDEYLKKGGQILYLIPEIALTAQLTRRLQKHFGGYITIYHSKFNNQERVELWHKIKSGSAGIVVGPRSALFLPYKNLQFIVVDEEHDSSFKQHDPAPRFQARDTAIYYASMFDAKVLLGSGTPSVESYFNALSGKYGLVELTERFGGIQLPEIEIVQVNNDPKKGKTIIGEKIEEAIKSTIERNKQVILFQNRRGYHPYLICGTCGFIPQCNHCDVSLTLHKYSNKLHCHYCGSTYPKINICPSCGMHNWLEKNFGTEKLEEVSDDLFPTAKIARMDVDSVKGKHAHEQLIRQFETGKIDILVGTQMVVKGLDFENLNLVGILDADGLLSFSDFRVGERAFQLMEQVSGRAGRRTERGKVIIQTLNPKNRILEMVRNHDYMSMYENEIAMRKEYFYPPFSRLIHFKIKHKDKLIAEEASVQLTKSLETDFGKYIVGPATPIIGRLRNLYIRELMIKLPKLGGKEISMKRVIQNQITLLLTQAKFKSVHIQIDVDPQ